MENQQEADTSAKEDCPAVLPPVASVYVIQPELKFESSNQNGAILDLQTYPQNGTMGQCLEPDTISTKGNSRCCSINRKLLYHKIFFFSFIGGIGVIAPYASIFLKQHGLTPQQIGLIAGLRPVVGFVCAPILGNCGDRFGIRKKIFLVSVVAWLVIYFGLFFLPNPIRQPECPEEAQYHRDPGHQPAGSPPTVISNSSFLNTSRDQPSNETAANATADPLYHSKHILRESIAWIYMSGSVQSQFLVALFVILGGEVVQAPTMSLADAGTLQTLGKPGMEQYGAQRAWGGIGFGIG